MHSNGLSQFTNTAKDHSHMAINVGVSDMKISTSPDETLKTHSLGSCIGVTVYDYKQRIGGLLHFQLPTSNGNTHLAGQNNPYAYADTGLAALFSNMIRLGCNKRNLIVKIAGGANVIDRRDMFNIGQKNIVAAKKFFWKNHIIVDAEDIGGDSWRTLHFEIAQGRLNVRTDKSRYELRCNRDDFVLFQ